MDKERIIGLTQSFNEIAQSIDGVECWLARDLQKCLGYKTWENFEITIFRAMDSVRTTGIDLNDHFREVTKMVGWIMCG